jgi:hypothetical protein
LETPFKIKKNLYKNNFKKKTPERCGFFDLFKSPKSSIQLFEDKSPIVEGIDNVEPVDFFTHFWSFNPEKLL